MPGVTIPRPSFPSSRGVAISRIIDNKHHPSDVVGGAFLGTIIAAAFLIRVVPRHYSVVAAPPTPNQALAPLLSDSRPVIAGAVNP